MNALAGILLGAALGFFATVVAEAFVRPRLARRSLAELLANDLSVHMQSIVTELAQRTMNKRSVPLPRPFPSPVYSAIVSRLGELPAQLVGEVLLVYRLIERLNEIASRASAALGRMQDADAIDRAVPAHLEEEVASNLASYDRFLRNTGERMNALQPKLIAVASPWWSPRFRKANPPQSIDAEALTRRVAEMKAEQDRSAAQIRSDRGS